MGMVPIGMTEFDGWTRKELCAEIERLRADLHQLREKVFSSVDRHITMKGRTFTAESDGSILDNNFDFDASLKVSGDFVDDEKQRYAEMIASALNAVTHK